MIKETAGIMVVILVAHTLVAAPELSGTPAELKEHLESLPGQVTLSGTAERRVEADLAVVTITVLSSERQLRSAMERNRDLRAGIVTELTAAGIDKDRIHTSRFASTPAHSSWTGKVKQYHVSSTVRVNAESEDEVHQVAGQVDERDEVTLDALEFELSEKDALAAELLGEAFNKLATRKQLYESSLGATLIPRRVGMPKSKHGGDQHVQWPLRDDESILSVSSVLTNPELTMTLHALEQRAPDLNQFEELVLKVGIVVTYDLVPGEGRQP
jgi:uncharacterized protein YggE